MLRPSFPFLLLLSLPPVGTASGADVLVADSYVETPELMRFARTFRTPNVLAICAGALAEQSARVKTTGCELERCPEEGCAPGQCRSTRHAWREIAFYSDCHASAFLLGIAGLKPGPIQSATADSDRNRIVGHMEGYRFRFSGREYRVRVVMVNEGSRHPSARLEVLRDGQLYSVLSEQDAHDLSCAVPWMGDLNNDGAPDVVVSCFRNIHERTAGLFLSGKGESSRYEFIGQREVGGSI